MFHHPFNSTFWGNLSFPCISRALLCRCNTQSSCNLISCWLLPLSTGIHIVRGGKFVFTHQILTMTSTTHTLCFLLSCLPCKRLHYHPATNDQNSEVACLVADRSVTAVTPFCWFVVDCLFPISIRSLGCCRCV